MHPFHKRPPMKKRHTKPCRFYQTARCPLSAEECDFAHVLSNEPTLQSPTHCRYFAAGRCVNGSRCRYRHVIDIPPAEDTSVNLRVRIDGEDGGGNDIMRTSDAVEGVLLIQDTLHSISRFSGMYPWHVGGPYSNPFSAGQVYSSSVPVPVPAPAPAAYAYHHHPRRPDIASSSSTCSSLSSDEGASSFTTEDPKYTEHSHQCQSRIRIADELPLVHVPPFSGNHFQHHHLHHPRHYPQYHQPHSPPPAHAPLDTSAAPLYRPSPPANAYGTYVFQRHVSPVSPLSPPTKGRSKSRSGSRHKIANYKTKPCKFYKASGTCPNGDECTFIHEEPKESSSPGNAVSPALSPRQLPPGLPPKPVSLAEENRKKNYFPISWRVIGGGVLIGGPKLPLSQQEEGIDFEEEEEATMNDDGADVTETKEPIILPPKPITRTRSSSNPPTPTTSHVKIQTLFSAESPGNL